MAGIRNPNLSKGDLAQVLMLEHEDDPKRYCIQGRFKGYRKWHILARIGEGKDDVRPAEAIKTTAETLTRSLISLYATDARLRAEQREKELA